MAVLIRAAVIALLVAGCYRPDVRDCTVTCVAEGDCAAGQVCADGWCTAPTEVGTCAASIDAAVAVDASLGVDASVADAAPPDAAPAELHLVVQGRGKVVVDPLGVECVGTQATPGDCVFPVTPGSSQTLLPVATHPQSSFLAWTTANCSAEPGACVLAMDPPVVLVGASFD